jgi:hypothetical protein
MPLIDSLNNYRNSIIEANGFINVAFQQDAAGNYLLPQNQREFITDSSFLKTFIVWETFLESVCVKYLLGEPSILGTLITRHAQPLNADHAHQLLIGTQKYVDWADPQKVKRLCSLYFGSVNHIDTSLSSIYSDLLDLKTIRNAAAHLSSTTSTQLDSLAKRLLRSPQSNIRVSQLIFSVDPASLAGDTIFTTYLTKLDIVAEGIANG